MQELILDDVYGVEVAFTSFWRTSPWLCNSCRYLSCRSGAAIRSYKMV